MIDFLIQYESQYIGCVWSGYGETVGLVHRACEGQKFEDLVLL